MKTLYFDCFSGASGNMILGGLISLGVDPAALKAEIGKLEIAEFEIKISEVNRCGIGSIHVDTKYPEEKQHRHLSDINKILDDSGLSDSVKGAAKKIFQNLAEAESKVHGVDIDRVHFHEVGAMDAIIDVVGACIGFEMLEIERFQCSKIHVGSGFVNTDHGKYPVPPPAVSELLRGMQFYSSEVKGELLTPTGAAILKTFCEPQTEMFEMDLEQTGYGAGTREYDGFANVLRMMIGQTHSEHARTTEQLVLLETNLDDMTGEALGYLIDMAIAEGARDCWFTPILMKKNRPAYKVSVLAAEAEKEKMLRLLYTESSTIGVRIEPIRRECLKREISVLSSPWGDVEIKLAYLDGKVINVKPEFDQLRRIAETHDISLKEVALKVAAECAEIYEGARVIGTTA